MNKFTIPLENEKASNVFAAEIAHKIEAPLAIGFTGPLGAGKTSIIRAMLRELGIKGPIKSPTYALLESYACVSFTLHHFDLYRIASEEELEFLGFRDCFTSNAVCCIEWPEKAQISQQVLDIQCILSINNTSGRLLEMHALTPSGERVLHQIADRE